MYCEAKSPPRMALLYEDTQRKVKLKVRELIFTSAGTSGDGAGVADLNEVDVLSEELEMGASHLIPVPAPLGMDGFFAAIILPVLSFGGPKRVVPPVGVLTLGLQVAF